MISEPLGRETSERGPPVGNQSFQGRVGDWMGACFPPEVATDTLERGDRFLEEALELLQANGYPAERIAALVGYTYNRPVGDAASEVGGVMVTLAAYCNALGVNLDDAAKTEVERISDPVLMAKIRTKWESKPTGSALPVAAAPQL